MCCSHKGSSSELEQAFQFSLFKKIDFYNLECLNEEIDGSGKTVFKDFDNRLDRTSCVTSCDDEELLFNIPFTGSIKLRSIRISGADDESHPNVVKLYKNRGKMSFDDTQVSPDQHIHLSKDPNGEIEYPVKTQLFSSMHHLSLYFPTNFGAEKTCIYYIGLRGEFSERHEHGVTICNYEVRPNVAENKNDLTTFNHAVN